ncbi:selenide, water dikinase [Geobacter sp. SVR]|nr:selenide, water dikinase [Geobacter sp. SVR]
MGPETSDDAGVYRIGPSCALVETADIITPLVDDPFTFGRIAAANAISDVYAMGGRPVTAMNLVFFPACSLPGDVLREILAGGQSVLQEAGVCLVGGHTVEDDELKYGLSVTGLIDPEEIIRNSTARPGDVLVLTKPLGTGIIATAIKAELAPEAAVAEAAGWMTTLNRQATELMRECRASAATDVTGFGLIGHAVEMASGAGVTFRLELAAVPLMHSVAELMMDGMVPAGCYRNRDHYGPSVNVESGLEELLPLFDPQTSGGMLIALAPEQAGHFMRQAAERGIFAREIGTVLPAQQHVIEIV